MTPSTAPTARVFLLSPAHCGGERAKLLFRPGASFELAVQLRTPKGAALGDVFSFLSGLYFRGKMAYVARFGNAPASGQRVTHPAYVITTDRGLVPPQTHVSLNDLRAMGEVPVDANEPRYRAPIERDARKLLRRLPEHARVVLLGSVAGGKYLDVLLPIFGERLVFPADFVGRGDMSRGGLMLRHAEEGRELTYVPVSGTVRRGARPPKLIPRKAAIGLR